MSELIRFAPAESLVNVVRLWPDKDLAACRTISDLLVARFNSVPVEWFPLIRTLTEIEAVLYVDAFSSALPDSERDAGEKLLTAIADGRESLSHGWLQDMGSEPLTSPRLAERMRRLKQLRSVLDEMPEPFPLRAEVVRRLQPDTKVGLETISVSGVALLEKTDPFSLEELRPLCSRIASAAREPDSQLALTGWPLNAQQRMSSAWAAKAAAAVSSLGPVAHQAIRSVVGDDDLQSLEWALDNALDLVACRPHLGGAEAVVVAPQQILQPYDLSDFLREAAGAALQVSGLPHVILQVVNPDGSTFAAIEEGIVVQAGLRTEHGPLAHVLLSEYLYRHRSWTWFEWLDAVGKVLIEAAESVEDALSLVLAIINGSASDRSIVATLRKLSSMLLELKAIGAGPSMTGWITLDGEDLVSDWAFACRPKHSIGWRASDFEELSPIIVKNFAISLAREAADVISAVRTSSVPEEAGVSENLESVLTENFASALRNLSPPMFRGLRRLMPWNA